MQLNHLGLPVSDEERSLRFYSTYFEFDPKTVTRYSDGTIIVRNAHGFDLALHRHPAPAAAPPFLHFGFRLPSREAVHALRDRMTADGLQLVSEDDEPDLLSFKVLDPDGFTIEVYWEP
ncbi:MAG TPA: VOC family protein [Actinopolymorphaceae bacterium]|jgi:catechol 2,3-dioxygenase-like lactoylglutathione lyase family enzyme